MKEGWKKLPFDEVISFSQIGIVRNAKQQSDEYPYRYLKMNNIKNDNGLNEESFSFIEATDEEVTKFSLEQGDFLFNTRNSYDLVGKTCLYESNYQKPTLFNNNILRVRFKDYLIPKFVAYTFSSFEVIQDLEEMKSGTTSVVGIYYKSLKNLKIPIPPLPEQKRIVAILDEAFEAIDQAKANIEKNIQNAEELFQSKLNEVFSQKGDGWVEKKLGDLINVLNGYAFKSKEAIEKSDTQLLRMGNLYQNKLDLNRNPVFYPDSYSEEYKKFVLNEGDLIMSLTGTVDKRDYGYTVELPETEETLLLNQRIMKIIIERTDLINKSFLKNYLLSPVFLDKLYETASGTRQANLSSSKIMKIPIYYPSNIEFQKSIVDNLQSLRNETRQLIQNYTLGRNSLGELKKSILQKAFSGELTVGEAGLAGFEDEQDGLVSKAAEPEVEYKPS